MKAMILAAGLGTRLRPLTNDIPKALVKINNVPLLEIIVNKLKESGFDDITINVHHFADKVIDFVNSKDNFGINISISDERNLLLDTGGGIKKASVFFNNNQPFLVHNADIISNINLKKLYEYNLSTNAAITLAVNKRESDRYLLFDDKNNLTAWENKITGERKEVKMQTGNRRPHNENRFGYCGIQVMHPRVFKYFPDDSIFSIIDFYLYIASKETVNCFFINDSYWQDVGTIDELKTAENYHSKL